MMEHVVSVEGSRERWCPLSHSQVAFADMFELPPDTFLSDFTGGDLGTIRLLYYPGHIGQSRDPPMASVAPEQSEMREPEGDPGDESNTGISAHTDSTPTGFR